MRHYYRNLGASEVTTSWRYTNLFIIITINGLLLRINITQMWYKKQTAWVARAQAWLWSIYTQQLNMQPLAAITTTTY